MESILQSRDGRRFGGGFVVGAVAVPMQGVLQSIAPVAVVFHDIDLGSGDQRVADGVPDGRRLHPERGPMPLLILQLDPGFPVTECTLELPLRSDHAGVIFISHLAGGDLQCALSGQGDGLDHIDRIPARPEAPVAPFCFVQCQPVEIVLPFQGVARGRGGR